MNKFNNNLMVATLVVLSFVLGLGGPVTAQASGPAAVNLGTAGNFVILSKTGISTTGTTTIIGDIGVSPIAASAITGFGLILPAASAFSTSALVTGKVYASDYANPTPANLTTAVSDMQTAYTDAAGRSLNAITELGAGNIGGMTLASGLYKWGTGLTIPTNVTLSGGANDVWIFQVAQNLNISSGVQVILRGGAQHSNIFWVVAGQTTIGTTAVFNGNILDQTAIVLNTGAILNGRALAQTAVTLDSNAVTMPTSVTPTICPQVLITVCGTDSKNYYGNSCLGYGMPSNVTIASQGVCVVPTPQPTCSNLYWFDNTNTTCQSQRQFCGVYMYYGLQTFNTRQNCLNAVIAQPTCTPNWTCGWGSCVNGYQSQVATDSNNCGLSSSNANIACPAMVKACNPSVPVTPVTPPTTDAGCLPGNNFSITTGRNCNSQATTNATDPGCLPGNNFSITTGRNCNAATPNANALANANANASFKRDLTIGTTGDDVKVLQVWLNTHGYAVASSGPGSSGNETTYFGGLTRAALAKFQTKVGINPPLGNFGPITRAYLSANY